ncbi:hypothetical protein [Clostridium perfringens]|uniref:hypothetical protein n=1 Tax=Clostridium perfringens TaxID=1502 RepID=UPI0024BC43DD|nr:hypothetical protein [Clostridium perfringens]
MDEYLDEGMLGDNDILERVKIKFALLVYYEIIEHLYKAEQRDVREWIEDIIENKDELKINFIIENIKNMYSKIKLPIHFTTEDETDFLRKLEEENNEENNERISDNYLSSYSSIVERIRRVISEISSLEENNEENISWIYNEVMVLIEDLTENIDDYWILSNIKQLYEIIVFEDKNDNVCESIYKEILYSMDSEDEQFYLYKEEVVEILIKIESFLIGISEGTKEKFKDEDNDEENDEEEKNEIKTSNIIVEENIQLKKSIIKYLKAIEYFRDWIDNSDIKVDENLDIEVKWNDEKMMEFFEIFDELKTYTFNFGLESGMLSSGQVTYFELQYRLYDLIKKKKLDDNIVLLIDEGDIYMHPGIQVKFIKHTLKFLNEFLDKKNVQLIVTTNSPFIISDIPNSKILYIQRNIDGKIEMDQRAILSDLKTLGAPINELLINSFFMDNGIVGELAQDKITEIIKKIYSKENLEVEEIKNIEKIIDSIGDDIIRKKLESKIKSLKKSLRPEDKRNLIEVYKKRIAELEGVIVE